MKKNYWLSILLLLTPGLINAQSSTKNYSIIYTAVPFMAISPDSRAAAMGDAGAASTFDANAMYWNPGKLAFSDSRFGGSFSYTPWLRQIVNDMGLINASGFYKISDKQTVGASINFFNQGEIQFTDWNGFEIDRFVSNEFSISGGIAQKLSSDYSLGLNIKYIHSNLVGNLAIPGTSVTAKPGQTAAMDLGFYYNKTRPTDNDPRSFKKFDVDYGVVLQNIGGKINYGFGEYFIPANFKVGTQLSFRPDLSNRFSFLVDFNKLLVPSDKEDVNVSEMSTMKAIFSSFSDAPGGFSEELAEIMASIGFEYTYQELIALRAGYFHESQQKAGRQYLTAGVGLTLKERIKLDLAYLIPTKTGSPLANSWRVTLRLQVPHKSGKTDTVGDNIDQ
ncbi:type IX secretion system outer membrane channel protein PorV [Leadbetterella sp. DM7]|uniref:type IX secretion system outer membrane channel protein PorV n=1 Tax=Leadbetterella sp. DM7 TaxID=3235085 RepID=UPI00349E4F1B